MATQAPSTDITPDNLDTAKLDQATTEEGTPETITALPNATLTNAVITHIQMKAANAAITAKQLTAQGTNATVTIEVKVYDTRNIRLPTAVQTRTTTTT
jgi:recombinational DNA repair protein RecR